MADISNFKSNTLINGSEIDDTINNHEDYVTIDAGAANDYISNSGSFISINAGTGNDYVYNNYVIKRNSATGTYETVTPDFVTIDGGEGNDTINNQSGTGGSINSGVGDDIIYNRGNYVTIDAGAGNDSIYSYSNVNNIIINAGTGNDTVRNYSDYVTIDVGEGDDSIYSSGENVLILVDGGQNTVQGNVTIKTGTGNSTLTGDRNTQVYQYVGGNDVITNYSHEDVIHIASGNLDSYSFDGGDLIFHIGSGSIRLKNMTNHAITVKDSKGKTTTQIYGTGYSGQDVIKNLVKAWNKTLLSNRSIEKLDEAIKLCSHFNSIQEVIDQMIDDCRAAGDADTFLRDYCGIILDNEDTGAITGWDAGGLSIKTAHDIVGETLSSLQHVPDYEDATFKTSQGVTINISSTSDNLTADGKKVFDALYSWWADEALNLIEESYGVEFKDINKINFALTPSATYWGQTSGSYVTINMGSTRFNGDDDYNGNGVDRTIVHEFTHVAQNLFMGYFPQFLEEGFADLTCGIDDRNGKSSYIRSLAGNADKLANYLDFNYYATGESYYYAAGFMFYRYLAKQVSDSYDSLKSYAWKDGSSIVGTSAAELLTGSGKNQTISAGKGNDTITVYGEKIRIFGEDGNDYILISSIASGASIVGGAGSDSIYNYGISSTINGDTGDDSIRNEGSNVSISGGGSNDSIWNYGAQVTITGGESDDFIYSNSSSNYVTINAGSGNDSINNYGVSATIEGGMGDDSIRNEGSSVTIEAGVGDDSIWNYGAQVTITSSEGDDFIYSNSSSNYVTINGDTGNDSINNYGNYVSIVGGDGADSINNNGTQVTITGGEGNDSIKNKGSSVLISSSTGNDSIYNYWGESVTINAGNGNDSIYNDSGRHATIDGGEGDDFIDNCGDNSSIDGGSGNDTVHSWGSENVSIQAGAGDDSISSGGVNVSINAGAGNDTVNSWGDSVTINAGDNNDYISNTADNVSIFGGEGNDTIYNHGDFITIDGGEGDDSIRNSGDDVTINGGAGNDTICNYGDSVTINAGNGNDIVSLSSSSYYYENTLIQYTSGSGNDTVFNFNSDDTLQIGSGNGSYFSNTSNDNIIVTVGTGKIALVGAASLSAINIDGVWKDPAFLTVTNSTKSPVTVDSVVKTVDASKRTSAIKITGNKLANSISGGTKNDSIFGGAGNDSILGNAGNDKIFGDAGNDSLNGGNGDDTLTGGSGNDILIGGKGNDVFIYSAGNDSITDYAAGDKISLGADVTKTTLNGSDVVFTIGKGSLTIQKAKDKTLSLIDSKGTEYSTLVRDFFTVTNSTKSPTTIESFVKTVDASSRTKVIAITGNALANSINGGTKNDSIYGAAGNDSILGNAGSDKLYGDAGNDIILGGKGNDSLWGGAGNDTLTGGDGNDIFIYESGNDLITDYTAGQDKIQIASGTVSKTSLNGSDVLLNIGKGALTVKNAKGKTISLLDSAGKASSTVVGAQALTNSNAASVSIEADMGVVDASARTKAIAITGNALTNTISGGTKNDSIYGAAGNDSILGNDGNDKLYGDAGNDILLGGKGNDSLWGGAGNDTLTGGDGNDIFIYESGNDFISDYTAGQDKIQIASGTISKTSLNGSNVLLTIGKNSLTLKNAKGKTISLLDSSNKASSTVVGAQVLTNSNKANVTIGVDMGFVDSSARTKAISITGNALANTISSGTKNDSLYGAAGNDSILGNAGNDKLFGDAGNDQLFGGNGNDSLWGGAGNDSLWGDAGKDIFIYTTNEGTDKIFDYETGDILKILNADGTDASFKSSKYSGGDLTLTINGGGKIIFEDVASSTKFNINGSSYNINGSKLVKK